MDPLYNNNAILCDFIDTFKRKEFSMTAWQEITAAALVLLILLVLIVRSAVCKAKDRKWRAAERKLETVLQPKETIKSICPQKKGRVILTSKRVLFETKDGFHAVPVKTIKKVQGNNEKGNRTTVPAKMVSITIKADRDYEVKNNCEEFEAFAKQILKKTAPKKNRKKKESGK